MDSDGDNAVVTVRPGVVLAPALLRGATTVHLVRDRARGRTYELRPQVRLVLEQLQRGSSRRDIESAYQARFERPLSDSAWQSVLAVLSKRGLLCNQTGGESDDTVGRATSAPTPPALWRASWRMGRIVLPHTARRLGRVQRLLRPLLTRIGLVVTVALIVAATALLAARGADLLTDAAAALRHPLLLVATVLLLWSSTALHEVGHGVIAARYGGTVSEIGVFWRLPLVIPYCRVDDVLFLPSAGARVLVSLAGCLVNLIFLVPFAALWWWGPSTGWCAEGSALLCVTGAVAALANLLPVGGLDGAKALGHAFGMLALPEEAARYRRARRRSSDVDGLAAYPERARRVYAAMGWVGSGSVLLLSAAACALGYRLGRPYAAPSTRLVVLGAVAVVVGVLVVRSRAHRAEQADAAKRPGSKAAVPA